SYPLFLNGFRTSYEDRYVMLPVSRIAPDRLIAVPLLIDIPGTGFVAITEAHLEDYAGMYLRRNAPASRTGFRAALAPHLDEAGLKVLATTPHASPWRVIMVASEVGRLIESNIVINLNPPRAIADTSWIKPGKSAWDWWFGKVQLEEGLTAAMNTRTFLHLIDFAAGSGLDYVLVDDGWTDREDITKTVPEIDIR
ncbi:MAG: glycoside hydrolase family 97 protein, partial [bacterium]|nr:glycoside hydrolase family 97 protein [bacterium]